MDAGGGGGGGQPAEQSAELWRRLTDGQVLGRFKGARLDAFVLKASVLLGLEVAEGAKRPPRLATRSVPLSSWDEDQYRALKRPIIV